MIVYLKTEEEIQGFKEAGKITGKILQKILNEVREGVTTNQLDQIARVECEKHNVKPAFLNYGGYPAAICASVNKTLVHGLPNDIPLKDGDIVSIDIGVEKEGYIGDIADTVIVGQQEQYSFLINSCRLALTAAIEKAKDGNRISDISEQIYKTANSHNCRVPINYGGHGIDRYKLHANPFVPSIPCDEDNIRLRVGMIIAIEPMFIFTQEKFPATYVDGDGWSVKTDGLSSHCEHTVLVGFTKGIPLTERGEENE